MSLGPVDPLPKETVKRLRALLRKKGRLRDLALLNTHIDTMLRAGDLLSLRVGDVVEEPEQSCKVVKSFHLRQRKTNNVVKCSLFEHARRALRKYIGSRADPRPDDFLFPGRRGPITVRRYEQLIEEWIALLRWNGVILNGRYSTHSLRKAKPAHLYAATQDDYACMALLGHSSIRHTRRYLGTSVQKAHALAGRHPF